MGLWRMKGREIDGVCWRGSLSAPVPLGLRRFWFPLWWLGCISSSCRLGPPAGLPSLLCSLTDS